MRAPSRPASPRRAIAWRRAKLESADGPAPIAARIRVYLSSGRQGVNYRRNTWHHSLIALGRTSSFLVIDRGGAGENCDEIAVDVPVVLVTAE